MATTITPAQPHDIIGPGLVYIVHIDPSLTGGPFHLVTTISVPPLPSPQFWTETPPQLLNPNDIAAFQLGHDITLNQLHDNNGRAAVADDSVTLTTSVRDAANHQVDSANVAATWDPVSGLHVLQIETTRARTTDTSGIQSAIDLVYSAVRPILTTATGAIQVTLADIFSYKTLDLLTLTEMSSGVTCDPVVFSLTGAVTGIIVRISTVPDTIVPHTPDGDWYYPDLAVLTVFRGADREYRRGIHTTTQLITPFPGIWGPLAPVFPLGFAPPGITVRVDWLAGVCGQVFITQLP